MTTRPYCKRPAACASGTRGRCRFCHGKAKRNEAIVAHYAKGAKTIKAVAAYFGVSPQRARIILLREGALQPKPPARSRKALTTDQFRRFRTMCAKGVPAAYAHEEVRRV
jgi:transposase-like protein